MDTQQTHTETTESAARPGKKALLAAVPLVLAGLAAYAWRMSGQLPYTLLQAVLGVGVAVLGMMLHIRTLGDTPHRGLHIALGGITLLTLDLVLYRVLAADGSGIVGIGSFVYLPLAYLPTLIYGLAAGLGKRPCSAATLDAMTLVTADGIIACHIAAELALFYTVGDGLLQTVLGKLLMLFPICYCLGKAVTALLKKYTV